MAHAPTLADALWLQYLSRSTELDKWAKAREPGLISADEARAYAIACLEHALATPQHGATVQQVLMQNLPEATLAYMRADDADLPTQLRILGDIGRRFARKFNTTIVRSPKGARQARVATGGWAADHLTPILDDTPPDQALAAFAERVDACAMHIYLWSLTRFPGRFSLGDHAA